ncbi:HNH endonuclease [Orenia metallireducens]|uniref:HNH endonuclease n=1 Tax=Orenia metallireducens TaxID=1413210 RepID=A0A285G744_9FIRM|nr:HNH endonuclease signature motif containing protein [Orenia metallireducens]SNY19367.1 HNH endonuclease [Orenia metallireducens]
MSKNKKCQICGGELPKYKSKFCSNECFKIHRKEYKANRYKLTCDWCGNDFQSGEKNQRFCSTDCQYEWQRKSKEYNNSHLKARNRPELIKRFKNKFESKSPNFKYYSDYTGCDDYFKMECKICGHIQERNAQCVREGHANIIVCDNCKKIKLEEKRREENISKIIKLIKAKIENIRKEKVKPEIDRLKRIQRNHKYFVKCNDCGRMFFTNAKHRVHCNKCIDKIKIEEKENRKLWEGRIIKCRECGTEFEMRSLRSKYCSTKCMNKAHYREKELKKRKKLHKNGRINYNISLDKLIKRDNRICQLCGELIDEEDYCKDGNGYFIVGNNYPSIDHIVPVAKGGTHTWDNVQLAHHYCNSLKSDKIKLGEVD